MGLSAAWIAMTAGRRSVAAGPLPAAATPAGRTSVESGARFAYVGSFTSETRHAHGEGLAVYRIDATSGRWTRVQVLAREVNPSFLALGPRHVGFHSRLPYAYVINELDSTVATYRLAASGALEPLQVLPSTPATFTGDNTGAAIAVAPSGRFVYGSNRGHDGVGVFRVDESSGCLSPIGWEPTRGATPRFIGLDPAGGRLFAANQRGDSSVEFEVNQATGALRATGQAVATGTPACVALR